MRRIEINVLYPNGTEVSPAKTSGKAQNNEKQHLLNFQSDVWLDILLEDLLNMLEFDWLLTHGWSGQDSNSCLQRHV